MIGNGLPDGWASESVADGDGVAGEVAEWVGFEVEGEMSSDHGRWGRISWCWSRLIVEFAAVDGEFGLGDVRFGQILLDCVGFGAEIGGRSRVRFPGDVFGRSVGGGEAERDGRQGVVAFVEVGVAPGAVGQALTNLRSVDVAGVSVEVGEEVPAPGEGDGGGIASGFELLAALLLVFFQLGQVSEQEPQLAGGGDALAVLVGFGVGLGELIDLIEQLVAGDGVEDVVAVALEVAEVGGDGGARAAHAVGDLLVGEGLAVQVVCFEDAQADARRGRYWRVGHVVDPGFGCTDVPMYGCSDCAVVDSGSQAVEGVGRDVGGRRGRPSARTPVCPVQAIGRPVPGRRSIGSEGAGGAQGLAGRLVGWA